MGLRDYVQLPRADRGIDLVAFEWGPVRENQFKLGERISWGDLDRPIAADGVVWIGGAATTGERETVKVDGIDYEMPRCAFFRIKFDNDVIVSVEPVTESEYEALTADERQPFWIPARKTSD